MAAGRPSPRTSQGPRWCCGDRAGRFSDRRRTQEEHTVSNATGVGGSPPEFSPTADPETLECHITWADPEGKISVTTFQVNTGGTSFGNWNVNTLKALGTDITAIWQTVSQAQAREVTWSVSRFGP